MRWQEPGCRSEKTHELCTLPSRLAARGLLGGSGDLGAISSRTTELECDLGQVTYGHPLPGVELCVRQLESCLWRVRIEAVWGARMVEPSFSPPPLSWKQPQHGAGALRARVQHTSQPTGCSSGTQRAADGRFYETKCYKCPLAM